MHIRRQRSTRSIALLRAAAAPIVPTVNPHVRCVFHF
jgi:hypothetical protein